MHDWKTVPTQTVAGLQELYQQLLPTKLYLEQKAKMQNNHDCTRRMCGKGQESVIHVIAGCSAIVQTKYLERHKKSAQNSVL